jgi:predicted PurR-regulated permease PerM
VATAILAVIIIAMLYFGREIFVPIALAILLSFVLAPVVVILQRIHVPRGLAVVSVAILAFAFIFAMASLLATQLTQLAGELYLDNRNADYWRNVDRIVAKHEDDPRAQLRALITERGAGLMLSLRQGLTKLIEEAAAEKAALHREQQ